MAFVLMRRNSNNPMSFQKFTERLQKSFSKSVNILSSFGFIKEFPQHLPKSGTIFSYPSGFAKTPIVAW